MKFIEVLSGQARLLGDLELCIIVWLAFGFVTELLVRMFKFVINLNEKVNSIENETGKR